MLKFWFLLFVFKEKNLRTNACSNKYGIACVLNTAHYPVLNLLTKLTSQIAERTERVEREKVSMERAQRELCGCGMGVTAALVT